ncbi:MAG: hypothetical protein WAL85_20775 [Candidatus Korobacteraceae bacterium]
MYFEEVRLLNQAQYKKAEACPRINSTGQRPRESAYRGSEKNRARLTQRSPSGPEEAAGMLDATKNKLQELMQLLYLLSRDPAVPTDARYHVTVAQSEIALLTRQMQNAAEDQAGGDIAAAAGNGSVATNP